MGQLEQLLRSMSTSPTTMSASAVTAQSSAMSAGLPPGISQSSWIFDSGAPQSSEQR